MFDTILGHDRIKKQLKNDLKERRFHQAYLLSGPEHIGKMTLVKAFAQEIQSKRAFGSGFMELSDTGETLKVEEVRGISDFVSRRTGDHEWSILVIEHLERMTKSAANAFLKILEEPSQRFIYLMTTRKEQKLLPTVRSRLQTFRCTIPAEKAVRDFLVTKTNNEVLIEEILKLSSGRIGLALTMLSDETFLDRMRSLFDFAALFCEKDVVDRFALAEHLVSDEYQGTDLTQFLAFLAIHLGHEQAPQKLSRLQEVKKLFSETQVNRRLHLENLFLNL